MFHEAKQILRIQSFWWYVLVVPTTLEKVFSRSNFSGNYREGAELYAFQRVVLLLFFPFRFLDVSEEELNVLIQNAILQKTNIAKRYGIENFKGKK